MSTKSVIIAAGGSGGHIYPALAIADRLKKSHPELLIFFVGTEGGLENKIIPAKGYPLLHIPIGRLNSNVSKMERFKTLLQLPLAFLKAIWICLKVRPVFLLGVGGHASGPMLLMGAFLGFKTFIWEPNAFPGMANRYLSRFVSRIFVVFEKASKKLGEEKSLVMGYPMRQSIEDMKADSKTEKRNLCILVFGGSQGAQGINNAVLELVETCHDQLQGVQILLQSGGRDFERVKSQVESRGLKSHGILEVTDYIYDMENKYMWADVVVARAGMGSVSEIAAAGLPSILIPLATSADGHQQKNAEAMMEKGAAIMILQKDLTADSLLKKIKSLTDSPEARKAMSDATRDFYQPNGAGKIAERILSEVNL